MVSVVLEKLQLSLEFLERALPAIIESAISIHSPSGRDSLDSPLVLAVKPTMHFLS